MCVLKYFSAELSVEIMNNAEVKRNDFCPSLPRPLLKVVLSTLVPLLVSCKKRFRGRSLQEITRLICDDNRLALTLDMFDAR